jgi:hypothetical protein
VAVGLPAKPGHFRLRLPNSNASNRKQVPADGNMIYDAITVDRLNQPAFLRPRPEARAGIDPLIRLAEKAACKASFPVEFLTQSAEEMPSVP